MSGIAGDWLTTTTMVAAGIVLAVLILLALLGRIWRRRRARARLAGLYPSPGTGTDADVSRLLQAGERDLAIKLYRELYRVDLKSAELAVEALADTGRRP